MVTEHGGSAPAGASSVGRYGRRIGFWSLVALLFASLAAGPGGIEEIVSASGPGMAIWLFLLLPFVWGLPNVLVNAELSSAIPVEGGYYHWCRRALGPFWGFVAGWWTWTGSVFDNIIYPVIIAEYLGALWGHMSGRGPRALIVVGLIIVFGYLNYRGIRAVAFSSAIFSVLVILPWFVFAILAIPIAQYNPLEPLVAAGRTPAEGLGIALVVGMWFFSGYELPSAAAEEYEQSHKTLPRALMVLLVLSAVTYLVPLVAALGVSDDWAGWQDGSLAVVAKQVGAAYGGDIGALALGVAVTVGMAFGSIALFNGLLVPACRILLVMAEQGDFPRVLARLHPRHRTPWVAILLNCTLYAAFHWLDFSSLILLSMWNAFIVYLVIDAALVVLRWHEPDLPRPFRIPGGALGLVATYMPMVILIAWALWQSVRENWLAGRELVLAIGLAGFLAGPLIYALMSLWRRRQCSGPANPVV